HGSHPRPAPSQLKGRLAIQDSKLATKIDFTIGVDTHKASHTISIVDTNGGEHGAMTDQTTALGYRRMLRFATEHAPNRRLWAVEGTGSFGGGLTTYLLERGGAVAEIDRLVRTRHGAIDANRTALCHLKSLFVSAP